MRQATELLSYLRHSSRDPDVETLDEYFDKAGREAWSLLRQLARSNAAPIDDAMLEFATRRVADCPSAYFTLLLDIAFKDESRAPKMCERFRDAIARYLAGDEAVLLANASVHGKWAFQLPGVAAPMCECEMQGRRRVDIATRLDTVIIDADQHQVHLLWRGHVRLPSGPHDLVAMTVSSATHRRPAGVQAV